MIFGCTTGFMSSLRSLRQSSTLKQMFQLRWRHTSNSAIKMDATQKRKVLSQFQNQSETLMYDRQAKPTLYRWGPWVAGGQMLMWLNFADFYWRYSMDKNEETGELTLSPAWKRACISAVAIVAGVSIGGGLLHYISRSVATMRILNNGNTVRLETFRITGRGTRVREFPTAKLSSRDMLYTGQGPQGVTRQGSPQYSINATGSSYAFIMNRSGWFRSPKSFDTLFHRSALPAQ
ncbi:hypothetical protein LPJ64_000407 [Coemansia asiatica]|uniref:Uncharacterized protein n=1 Tax=Coemansia asiatica TaxID=1052880 RepID=A0A9W7XRX7_9FUNG|nr:hypothetical protein LPJ64_000407 [Coemansia asiatica]